MVYCKQVSQNSREYHPASLRPLLRKLPGQHTGRLCLPIVASTSSHELHDSINKNAAQHIIYLQTLVTAELLCILTRRNENTVPGVRWMCTEAYHCERCDLGHLHPPTLAAW